MTANGQARQLAARQDGVVDHGQLLRCGLTAKQIRGRVMRGLLAPLHHHVLLVAGAALTFRARVRAALLSCGPSAFASHRTAAVLWGIRRGEPETVDVTAPGSGPRRLAGVRVHRVKHVPPGDLRTRHGLRLSAPARTICELATTEPRDTVEHAIQEAAASLRLTPQELTHGAGRWGRRPGATMLRSILQDSGDDAFPRSWAERRLRWILRCTGLPQPDHTNHVIGGHRCDAVWETHCLIVEIDGIGTHGTPVGSSPTAR